MELVLACWNPFDGQVVEDGMFSWWLEIGKCNVNLTPVNFNMEAYTHTDLIWLLL